MTTPMAKRPAPGEYAPYYEPYIARVPDGDVVEILESQVGRTLGVLGDLGEARAGHRYAPGKWSVREVVGHVADSERVFAYRALSFARGEKQALPGFEGDDYVREAAFEGRPLASLAAELEQVRRATVLLFRGLPATAWERRGTANDVEVSVRALAYIIAGHERHHAEILAQRYR